MTEPQFVGLAPIPAGVPIEQAPPVEPLPRTSGGPDIDALFTPEGWKRYLDITAIQCALDVDRQIYLGPDSEPVTWAQAVAVYGRMQVEEAR